VSLTTGRGPLSARPAGRFEPPVPPELTYVEPFRRRVRGVLGGATVVDSEKVVLVHRQGRPPAYAFPAGDVGDVPREPEPVADGYVRVAWNDVESWYEEDEEVFMHPRNPYHRVDSVRTSRRLRVEVGGVQLVDTKDTVGVYETSLEPRLYVSRDHVRMELLRPSRTTTYCPYKGTATYWDAVVAEEVFSDVAWSYDEPLPESIPIRAMLCFDPDAAEVRQELPPSGM
jgi:uncharacterized protein (DUF427 family)